VFFFAKQLESEMTRIRYENVFSALRDKMITIYLYIFQHFPFFLFLLFWPKSFLAALIETFIFWRQQQQNGK